MHADHRDGWTEMFCGKASEPETSRPVDFYLPHLHLAPPLEKSHQNFFGEDFLHNKTRVPGPLCGVGFMILCLTVLVQHRLVMDRHIPC